jgi:hypothetical protein
VTDGDAASFGKAGTRSCTHGETDIAQEGLEGNAPPRRAGSKARNLLGESAARAMTVAAAEPPYLKVDRDLSPSEGLIGDRPRVTGMDES